MPMVDFSENRQGPSGQEGPELLLSRSRDSKILGRPDLN